MLCYHFVIKEQNRGRSSRKKGRCLAVLWERCATGARVLRVLGDSPCPAVPDAIDGLPVTELGPYCFAERKVTGGTLFPAGSASGQSEPHAVCGDFLEEVILPDTLHTLHSAAFYNCRRLRRLEFGPALASLGSDLFTNCRALTLLAVRAAPDAATGLKKLVGAISADVNAVFLGGPGAALSYPEYFELLDENAPAHLFNRTIEGEGYRLRQCFTAAGAVDFAAYDAAFAQMTVGEEPAKLCRLALNRLLRPYALSEAARDDYTFYLNSHALDAYRLAVAERSAADLRLLAGLALPTADAARLCAAAGWSEGAAILLGRPHRTAKSYDF